MKILLTAFEPFGKRNENNSLNNLNKINIPNLDKLVFPVSIVKFLDKFNKIDFKKYDLIIFLGEASCSKLKIELIARNLLDMKIPDNDNIIIKNEEIIKGSPFYLMTNYEISLISSKYNLSLDAGSFLCNYSYYHLLLRSRSSKNLFIHLPQKGDYTIDILDIINCFIGDRK